MKEPDPSAIILTNVPGPSARAVRPSGDSPTSPGEGQVTVPGPRSATGLLAAASLDELTALVAMTGDADFAAELARRLEDRRPLVDLLFDEDPARPRLH